MLGEYFITVAVLTVGYCVVRIAVWREFHLYPRRPASTPYDGTANSIDAAPLVNRLQQVRQDHQAQPHGAQTSFKQSFLVENQREKVKQLAFFQKPPPPEPTEEVHGATMLFV